MSPHPVFKKDYTPKRKNICNMGLRFSILGFAQDRVIEVCTKNGTKEIRLDITDLLLLNQIADFPNRSSVMKIIEDDKIFFWMSYAEILEELPILNMKKQALRDRLDKLVILGLLEKRIGKTSNMTFFRLTSKYESLKYDTVVFDTEKGCVVNDRGVYSDTEGVCSKLHTISEYKNNKKDKEKEYKEKELSGGGTDSLLFDDSETSTLTMLSSENLPCTERPATPTAEEFEDLWLMYERKGSKAKAKQEFGKLDAEEVATMRCHIPAYIQSRPERQYRQDFERYIKHKTFLSVVYSKNNEVLYDPESMSVAVAEGAKEQNNTLNINGTIYR